MNAWIERLNSMPDCLLSISDRYTHHSRRSIYRPHYAASQAFAAVRMHNAKEERNHIAGAIITYDIDIGAVFDLSE
jgi:hypothetical protein